MLKPKPNWTTPLNGTIVASQELARSLKLPFEQRLHESNKTPALVRDIEIRIIFFRVK